MVAVLVDSDSFAFNDGNAGHVCDLGSSPTAGQWDVLCVNSNTTVSTPSGWTLAETAVTNQGAYVFVREAAGGEGSTVTITTSGNHNTTVGWSRWSNVDALDTSTNTEVNSSTGGSTPAHSTGTLADTDELVIAFGALHSIQSANQNTPVWSAGYTPLTEAVQGSAGTGARQYIGYRTDAGTAAETPQVSWSGDGAFNRYMLVVTFTTVAGIIDGEFTATLPALTASLAGDQQTDGLAAAALPALTAALAGDQILDGALAGVLPALSATLAGDQLDDGALAATLPALTAFLTDVINIEPGTLTADGRPLSTLTAAGRAATLTAGGRP